MLVRSLRDLRKLKLKLERGAVQVTRAGGFYKARFAGHNNFIFGSTAQEATQRLLDSPTHIFRNNYANAVVRAKRNREGCK